MGLGELGGHLQPLGAFGDAGREHLVLAANQRVELALRNPGARRDLERAGRGKAAFHERRKRRIENAPAGGNFVRGLQGRFRRRSRRHHFSLTWYLWVPYVQSNGTIWYRARSECARRLSMVKPVLVTSAAGGRQGKTGRHVSEMLLQRGVAVRAFVHKIDERSEHLRALGAEIFEGDFLDIRSVMRAVQGTSSIYFAYPVQDGLLDATAALALAAREAGISRPVNLVVLQSSVDAPTPRMRQNYLSEQVFESAGIGAVPVRATEFYENLAALTRHTLPAQGAARLP